MIRQLDGMPDGVLGFEATGKVSTDDYTGVLAPAFEAAKAAGSRQDRASCSRSAASSTAWKPGRSGRT